MLSDRQPPRTLAVRAGTILATATGVLTLLASRDALDLGPVLVLAAVFGAAEACLYPAALACDTALLLLAVGCFVQVRPSLAAAATAPNGGLGQGLREGSPSPGATGRSARA
ncbi:hypothetical protein H6G65_16670 [Microcystis elabens FACHB-917]|nr:hypothetical protein [Microcystis elabens FACHB-917]